MTLSMHSSMTGPAAAGTITPVTVTGGDDMYTTRFFVTIGNTNARYETSKPNKADFIVEEGKEVDLATPVSVESESKMEVQTTESVAETVTPMHKYYCEPLSGKKFRSMPEVLRFLKTGSTRKKSTGGDATPSETPNIKKLKKSSLKKEKDKTTSFYSDSLNPPQSICWVLADSSADTSAPFVHGNMVPEGQRQEWDAVFSTVSQRNANWDAGVSNVH